jgi:Flp pilus assembly protein TadG
VRRRPSVRSRRGNVILEFALTSSLMMFLLLGTFQFGQSLLTYNNLVNAVRHGARYASTIKISNLGDATLSNAYVDAVRNAVVYGDPFPSDMGTVPIVPGLTPSQVDVQVEFDAGNVPRHVTVRLNSYTINAVGTSFTIQNKPSLRFPFLGRYCPTGC